MLLTFRTGQEALAAVAESTSRTVGGEPLMVALQTPDWLSCVENEFRLTRSNTAETYAATSNSLLGEDFSIPSMSFDDMDGKYIVYLFYVYHVGSTKCGLYFQTSITVDTVGL